MKMWPLTSRFGLHTSILFAILIKGQMRETVE